MSRKSYRDYQTYRVFALTVHEETENISTRFTYIGLVRSIRFCGLRVQIEPLRPIIRITETLKPKTFSPQESKHFDLMRTMSTIDRLAVSIDVGTHRRGNSKYMVREIKTSEGDYIILSERPSDERQVHLWAREIQNGSR